MTRRDPKKKVKTYRVKLTARELCLIRDLFNVGLPGAGETVSQTLAKFQGLELIEEKIWKKFSTAMAEAGVPLDDDAPDFVVVPTGHPPLGIFMLATEADGNGDVFGSLTSDDDRDVLQKVAEGDKE